MIHIVKRCFSEDEFSNSEVDHKIRNRFDKMTDYNSTFLKAVKQVKENQKTLQEPFYRPGKTKEEKLRLLTSADKRPQSGVNETEKDKSNEKVKSFQVEPDWLSSDNFTDFFNVKEIMSDQMKSEHDNFINFLSPAQIRSFKQAKSSKEARLLNINSRKARKIWAPNPVRFSKDFETYRIKNFGTKFRIPPWEIHKREEQLEKDKAKFENYK